MLEVTKHRRVDTGQVYYFFRPPEDADPFKFWDAKGAVAYLRSVDINQAQASRIYQMRHMETIHFPHPTAADRYSARWIERHSGEPAGQAPLE